MQRIKQIMRHQIMNECVNNRGKNMKVKNHLHNDITYKCFNAPLIMCFNIKDPCCWAHMQGFIIIMHLINV
jgi:hypothetical protein